MTYTADTVVVGVEPKDIPLATFQRVLTDHHSPAASTAGAGYAAIAASCVSVAFALAVFHHESQYATDPTAIVVKYQTNNPGNCRSLRPDSGAHGSVIDTPRGEFVQYQTWADGWRDLAYRLTDPHYVYVQEGRRTIRQIIERFAPATDSNDTEAYINAVVADMNGLVKETPVAVDISGFVPPKIVQQWFKPNGVSYLGEDMVMFGVCVHQTGNTSPGAEAQQNVDYMNSAECIQRQASWHATIGLHQIIETIPQTKQAFHASDGSGPGNTHFKAIEHVVCYPVGSAEYRQVMLNGAWYTAKSLRDAGLPCNADTVKQHHDFARDGKDCPMQFRDHGEWDTYTAYVKAFYDRNEWGGGAMPTQPPVGADPVTGKFIHQDFVVWFAAHGGVDVLGRPLTGAFIRDGLLVQYFERFVLERHPENKEPYRVLGRRLGAEALAREYPQGAPA